MGERLKRRKEKGATTRWREWKSKQPFAYLWRSFRRVSQIGSSLFSLTRWKRKTRRGEVKGARGNFFEDAEKTKAERRRKNTQQNELWYVLTRLESNSCSYHLSFAQLHFLSSPFLSSKIGSPASASAFGEQVFSLHLFLRPLIFLLPFFSTLWNKNWQIISFVRVARVNSINDDVNSVLSAPSPSFIIELKKYKGSKLNLIS